MEYTYKASEDIRSESYSNSTKVSTCSVSSSAVVITHMLTIRHMPNSFAESGAKEIRVNYKALMPSCYK